ncbi:MAG: hypothetical protein ACWA5A_10835, partial [Marinibacterium sp.]
MAAETGLLGLGTVGKVVAVIAAVAAGGIAVREGIRLTAVPDVSLAAPDASAPVQDTSQSAVTAVPAKPEPATPPEADDAPTPPAFDVVRVDPDGTSVVAGTAIPGSQVALYLDGAWYEETGAGPQGKFAMFLFFDPDPRPRVLTLRSSLDGKDVWSEDQIILAPMQAPAPATEQVAEATPDPAPAPATCS